MPDDSSNGDNILTAQALREHFGKIALADLVTASRTFPITSRVDLQNTLDHVFSRRPKTKVVGVHSEHSYETLTVAHLMRKGNNPVVVGPLQHQEVDVGEVEPARCLERALWLSQEDGLLFALLISPALRFGTAEGVHLEIAVPPGEAGANFSRKLLDEIARRLAAVCTYRGKVLSFELSRQFSGSVSGVRVHKLQPVQRDEVILPEKTIRLLERNVHDFIRQRQNLRDLGMAAKKGLLFYGPPGTGKTHTIRYLASQLPDHTTFLVTAEHMGLLEQYFRLAR